MNKTLALVYNYLIALYRNRKMTREAIQDLQAKLWRKKLSTLGQYPAYANLTDTELTDFEIISIEKYRAQMEQYNCHSLNYETAYDLGLAGENGQAQTDISIGLSTGTSFANRGIFITDSNERILYVANILAKAFSPIELLQIKKIALCLRANNPLYETINNRQFELKYFQLSENQGQIAKEIIDFNPDVVIAPTQIILNIAKSKRQLPQLKHLFYGAEAMNAFEAAYITKRLCITPRPIYQATEGFLGIGCTQGSLHINEDNIIIEREYIDEKRFVPIITDLTRNSQAIIRLKLDDIWQEKTCLCKSAHLAIEPIEGRIGDIWHLKNKKIFPSEIVKIIAAKIDPSHFWQIIGSNTITKYCVQYDEDAIIIAEYLDKIGLKYERFIYSPNLSLPKMRHIGWQN